jgi:serine protease DegQ
VNLRGELIGINAASFNPRGSAAGNIGLGFAIPSNLAREVMRQLMAYGEVRRGSLGLYSRDVTPEIAQQFDLGANARGALVARVYRGSPAEVAGVKPGDLIVGANGQRIDSSQQLHNLEGLLPVGQAVSLDLLREGQALTVSALLKAQPREIEGATLDPRLSGATFTDLPERYRQQGLNGVVVSKVAPGSRAARNELDAGDLVLGINRRGLADLTDFRARLSPPPKVLVFALRRGSVTGELPMQ